MKVYSYLRFSDPKQATGGSIDRQLQYAQRWAKERGLELDSSLSMRDEGLSAFHQKHVSKGALGVFLKAVDDGLIPKGSYLIVEGLDRLSRAEPILAQGQLNQIISAGITVVTACDNKEYNREGLKAQPMDLVYSLLVMIRAHEESDTKSKRVKAAIKRQCEGWIDGSFRGIIRNGKDPEWARWNGKEFELDPELSEATKYAINKYRSGIGGFAIMADMQRKGMRLFDNHNGVSAVSFYKLMKRHDLYGLKIFNVDDQEYRIKDYYPALMTEQEFYELRSMVESRTAAKGKSLAVGILTGFGVFTCGYCGGAIFAHNTKTKKVDGSVSLTPGNRRVMCKRQSNSFNCPVTGTSVVEPIEKAIFEYCSDQFNLTGLLEKDNKTAELTAKRSLASQQIKEQTKKLDRVTQALFDSDEAPASFAKMAHDIEASIAALKRQEIELTIELARESNSQLPAAANEWKKLKSGVLSLDEDSRIKARQLIKETFESIRLFHKGVDPDDNGNNIDLMIQAKGGKPRFISIDRKTGELIGWWKVNDDCEKLDYPFANC